MSSASKTPLGRLVQGRDQNKDLIKTPTELAELYVSALRGDHSKAEDNHDLSTVLSNVSFLYGNNQELVDLYDALVLSAIPEISDNDAKRNLRQSSATFCLQNALDQFQLSLTSNDMTSNNVYQKETLPYYWYANNQHWQISLSHCDRQFFMEYLRSLA